MARKDGAEAMRVMTWGDSEQKRVFVAETQWEFGRFPHQGLALYRPFREAPVRFFAQANVNEAKDRKVNANAFIHNLLEWRRKEGRMTIVASWKLFDESVYAPCQMNVCISPDGKTLVCRARRQNDKVWLFGVWKTEKLFKALADQGTASKPVDAQGLCERIFASPWGARNVAM